MTVVDAAFIVGFRTDLVFLAGLHVMGLTWDCEIDARFRGSCYMMRQVLLTVTN